MAPVYSYFVSERSLLTLVDVVPGCFGTATPAGPVSDPKFHDVNTCSSRRRGVERSSVGVNLTCSARARQLGLILAAAFLRRVHPQAYRIPEAYFLVFFCQKLSHGVFAYSN